MKDYRIAGHIVSIDFTDSNISETLLPNFAPFAYEGQQKPAVTIRIVSDHEWEQDVQDIGTFDVGGSDYAVFRTAQGATGSTSMTLTDIYAAAYSQIPISVCATSKSTRGHTHSNTTGWTTA